MKFALLRNADDGQSAERKQSSSAYGVGPAALGHSGAGGGVRRADIRLGRCGMGDGSARRANEQILYPMNEHISTANLTEHHPRPTLLSYVPR